MVYRWIVACVICSARAGQMCSSLVTGRRLAEGHTLRIWREREWIESHPEAAPVADTRSDATDEHR